MTGMSRAQRHEKALEIFRDSLTAYGCHPTRREERYINNDLAPWLGDDATPAQITEALAHTHDLVNLPGKTLGYEGQDIEPGDQLYSDALGQHEESIEASIYTIIQEIDKE